MKRYLPPLLIFFFLASSCAIAAPRQIVLFVGDGMGFEHVKAASCFTGGKEGSLSFEKFPYKSQISTAPADTRTTESASSATAMATGRKVATRVLSKAIPGDGSNLETVLEKYKKMGFSTGLVTTAWVEHFTPAAFAAHNANRRDYDGILTEILGSTQPDVLLGGGRATAIPFPAGYSVVKDSSGLKKAVENGDKRIIGRFGDDYMPYDSDPAGGLPRLPEMTKAALEVLDDNPKGLFLMVECARIDHASTLSDIDRVIREVAACSAAVSEAVKWAEKKSDAMIIVAADHETGGLKVETGCVKGMAPVSTWATREHTGVDVPIYGMGKGAEAVKAARDNTDVYKILTGNR